MSELVQYLEGHTLEISVILEIGACDGNDTLFYAKTFPTAEIHAFEPRHDNYMKILKKVQDQSLPNVYTYPFALSDKVGEVSFYLSSGTPPDTKIKNWHMSSSILPPKEHLIQHPWCKFENKTTVFSTTIDKFCEIRDIKQIDFIHMDVQGAELLVLAGASKMINNIKSVWLEVSDCELYAGQPLRKDVENYMTEKGFSLIINGNTDQLWVRQ